MTMTLLRDVGVLLTALCLLGACDRKTLTAGALTPPGDGGRFDGQVPIDTGAAVADAGADAEPTPNAFTPMLTLLAGELGGAGYLDEIGPAARFSSPKGVVYDGSGTLLVADSGNHTIRKIDIATGAVTTLAGSPYQSGYHDATGIEARFYQPQGLALDGAGHLFVTDGNDHRIRQVVIATGAVTSLAGTGDPGNVDGSKTGARFNRPTALACDGAGNLFVADNGNHTIRQVVIATGAVTTLAGPPSLTVGAAEGSSPAEMDLRYWPSLAADGAGHLFLADGDTIRQLVIATGAVTTLAGAPGCGAAVDGAGPTACFAGTTALAADGAGDLLVVDKGALRQVVIATGGVTTLAGLVGDYGAVDGSGEAARLGRTHGITIDRSGRVFIADSASHAIRSVEASTRAVTTLAGTLSRSGAADGTGTAARFAGPVGIAGDGAGGLLVTDNWTGTLRRIDIATASVTTLAGSTEGRGSRDGTGAEAQFFGPSGVACDGAGHVFVADSQGHTIRRVVMATGEVTTLAGVASISGQEVTESRDGTGSAARFFSASGLAYDGEGNLFVADYTVIRQIVVASGAVTTLAGSAGELGTSDGIGSMARFGAGMGEAGFLMGLATDGAGHLFVADTSACTIRKIVVATAEVTTLAGVAGVSGSQDGIGPAARFNSPQGLAYDGAGHLFVADMVNHTVRRVDVTTGKVTTVLGSMQQTGVSLAPLPARLNRPVGLAFGTKGELYIVDNGENAVLTTRL